MRYQTLAFAGLAPAILVLNGGNVHSATRVVLSAHQGCRGPDQSVDIDAIGLDPARPAVDQQAGSVEHMVVDAVGAQDAVQPEAVVACFVAADHPDRLPKRCFGPARACPISLSRAPASPPAIE